MYVYDPGCYYKSFDYSKDNPNLKLVGREGETWRYSSESWDPWNGYYGLADIEKGVMIVPADYDTVGEYSGGLYKVKYLDRWGCFDPVKYKQVIPCRYDEIGPFIDGVAIAILGNEKIILDTSGNILGKE